MVQVDLAMSYGFGSGLALAAHRQLKREGHALFNAYAQTTLTWFSLFFVPHAMYLIWSHPAWHTMFVALDRDSIPPWVVACYAIGIAVLGLAGFAVTATFVKKGDYRLAWAQFALSAVVTFTVLIYGWDGTGYVRFFYPGSGADWAAGIRPPIGAFWDSEIAHTIYWILPSWLVPYLIILWRWVRADRAKSALSESPAPANAAHEAAHEVAAS